MWCEGGKLEGGKVGFPVGIGLAGCSPHGQQKGLITGAPCAR